jgi:tetratricopeptide (TPR) repeat protein
MKNVLLSLLLNLFLIFLISCGKVSSPPKDSTASLYEQAYEKERKGDFLGAFHDYSEAIRENPTHSDAYYGRALIHSQQKNKEAALADLASALHISPRFARAYYERGKLYQELNRKGEALKDYENAIRYEPTSPDFYSTRALLWTQEKKYNEALLDWDRCITLNPHAVEAFYHRASLHYLQKNYTACQEDFTQSLKHSPRQPYAYFYRAQAKSAEEDYASALADYDSAIQLESTSAEFYFHRAHAKAYLEDTQGACHDYEKAIALAPETPSYYEPYGEFLIQHSLEKRAEEIYSAYLLKDQNSLAAYAQRAHLRTLLGKYPEAQHDYLEIYRRDPQFVEASLKLGDLYMKQGEPQKALLLWKDIYQKKLENYRELSFLHPLAVEFLDPPAFVQEFLNSWHQEPFQHLADQILYEQSGALSPNFQEIKSKFMKEETAGFYDIARKKLSVLNTQNQLEKQKSVLLHEMTHALADQHFDLQTLQRSLTNEDELLAFRSLLEGEALFLMHIETNEGKLKETAQALYSSHLLLQEQPIEEDSPHASDRVREQILFPYTHGLRFVCALFQKHGWQGINQAYRSLPQSSEHILHPEKYLAQERPLTFAFPQALPLVPTEWTLTQQEVYGEWKIQLLLRSRLDEESSIQAAQGWNGDRYFLFRSLKKNQNLFAWVSTWESESNAQEFLQTMARYHQQAPYPFTFPFENQCHRPHYFWKKQENYSALWHKEKEVFFLQNTPAPIFSALSQWLLQATPLSLGKEESGK